MTTRRQAIRQLLTVGLIAPLAACAQGTNMFAKKGVIINAVLFNYTNRTIFDVFLNGRWVGGAREYGGGAGVMTGVPIPFGPQTLTWRLSGPKGTPHNGETVSVKNALTLSQSDIPDNAHYIGIHIYPDDTAEFTFAEYGPDITPRGQKILDERLKK